MHDGLMDDQTHDDQTHDDQNHDGLTLRDDADAHRYEALSPGGEVVGYLAYDLVPARTAGGRGSFVAVHTVVEPESQGQGVAGRLARAALDRVRAEHLVLIPQCSYVRSFVDEHPEEQDLLP